MPVRSKLNTGISGRYSARPTGFFSHVRGQNTPHCVNIRENNVKQTMCNEMYLCAHHRRSHIRPMPQQGFWTTVLYCKNTHTFWINVHMELYFPQHNELRLRTHSGYLRDRLLYYGNTFVSYVEWMMYRMLTLTFMCAWLVFAQKLNNQERYSHVQARKKTQWDLKNVILCVY